MFKIRRPLGRLIFNMGIAVPGKTVFLIETAPSLFPLQVMSILSFYRHVAAANLFMFSESDCTQKCGSIYLDLCVLILSHSFEIWSIYMLSYKYELYDISPRWLTQVYIIIYGTAFMYLVDLKIFPNRHASTSIHLFTVLQQIRGMSCKQVVI